MDSGIYEILNSINGQRYVGSAISFAARWKGHRTALRRGSHHSARLQRAFSKYGESAFQFARILICSRENLIAYEQIVMDALQPEYNVARLAGSTLGVRPGPNTRDKLSRSMKGNTHLLGHTHSIETRARMSASRIGKTPSTETRAKLSARSAGRVMSTKARENNAAAQRGKKLTEETRRKISISQSLRGHVHSSEARAKMSSALIGRRFSDEHRMKLSTAKLGNKHAAVPRTAETRARMVDAWKLRKQKT